MTCQTCGQDNPEGSPFCNHCGPPVVATSQAVLWFPFGLPWVRVLVAIAALTVLVQAPLFLSLLG